MCVGTGLCAAVYDCECMRMFTWMIWYMRDGYLSVCVILNVKKEVLGHLPLCSVESPCKYYKATSTFIYILKKGEENVYVNIFCNQESIER